MTEPQAEAQLFLYDLANLAKEHWFKPDENWALSLANETDKAVLLKKYHPILYISGENETLKVIAEIMRDKNHFTLPGADLTGDRHERKLPPTYLIAYNPARQRK